MTWNIERGLELSVADLSRATVLHAALAERVSAFFESVEVLACPVTQVAPFDVTLDWVHDIDGQPQHTYLDWMASAYLISVTGLPAISVPAGFTPDGLPVGLQLVGRRRADWPLLGVAHAFEAATGHGRPSRRCCASGCGIPVRAPKFPVKLFLVGGFGAIAPVTHINVSDSRPAHFARLGPAPPTSIPASRAGLL